MNLSRRQFLGGGLAGAATLLGGVADLSSPSPWAGAAPVTRGGIMPAGSLPYPTRTVGADQVPEIEHFVVVMMENHSFDNILGLIGRGDGFTLGPTASRRRRTPTATATTSTPSTCRPSARPTASATTGRSTHEAYDRGTCQGFVTSTSAEAMGYFTKDDLPFSCGMASTFPIADRYFCSAMAQTDPNRRYLIAGTSLGLIDDIVPVGTAPRWRDLRAVQQARHHLEGLLLDAADPRVFLPLLSDPALSSGLAQIDQFYRRRRRRERCPVQPGRARTTTSSPRRTPRTSSSATSSWARSSTP